MIDRPIASEANFLFGQTLPYNKRYNDVLLYSRQSPNGKYTIAWGKHSYYVFDTQENILSIQYSNGNSYRFSISGVFIDEQLYVRDSEKLLVGLKAYQAAKKHFSLASSTNIKDYDHILTLITNSLSSKISDNAKANVYRLLGDIQLRCGNKSIAINAYKTAISFNPKIGLKQMLKNLIKN